MSVSAAAASHWPVVAQWRRWSRAGVPVVIVFLGWEGVK
jgi:hypothetical protein